MNETWENSQKNKFRAQIWVPKFFFMDFNLYLTLDIVAYYYCMHKEN